MRACCTICSDLFDQVTSVLAAPCGHTFHASCLLQWIERSKTCPECRKQANSRNLLKLYFNISNDESVNSDALENEVQTLKANLREKNSELVNCEKEKEEIRYYVQKAEKEAEELKQSNYVYSAQVSNMKLQLKSIAKLEDKVQKLEQRNVAQSNDLELLNNVQTIVSGTQVDVQDILSSCGVGSEAVKQLATYCSVLKRELQQVIDSKQQLRSEVARLKKDTGLNGVELKRLREQNKQLKDQLSNVEKENLSLMKRSLEKTTTTLAKATVSYESPTPERLKQFQDDLEITPVSKQIKYSTDNLQINRVCYEKYPNKTAKYACTADINSLLVPITPKASNDENSIIRTGYNGFGGHSNFISRSTFVVKASNKRKLTNSKKV